MEGREGEGRERGRPCRRKGEGRRRADRGSRGRGTEREREKERERERERTLGLFLHFYLGVLSFLRLPLLFMLEVFVFAPYKYDGVGTLASQAIEFCSCFGVDGLSELLTRGNAVWSMLVALELQRGYGYVIITNNTR